MCTEHHLPATGHPKLFEQSTEPTQPEGVATTNFRLALTLASKISVVVETLAPLRGAVSGSGWPAQWCALCERVYNYFEE